MKRLSLSESNEAMDDKSGKVWNMDKIEENRKVQEELQFNNFGIDYNFCPFCGGEDFVELRRDSDSAPYEAMCDNCGAVYSKSRRTNNDGFVQGIISYFYPSNEHIAKKYFNRRTTIKPKKNTTII